MILIFDYIGIGVLSGWTLVAVAICWLIWRTRPLDLPPATELSYEDDLAESA